MKNYRKYKWRILLAAAFLFAILPKGMKVTASTEELKLSQKLTQWELDEDNDLLYAISSSDNSLLIMNAATMELEEKITLPGQPSDFFREENTIYISMSSIDKIGIYDLTTKSITKSFTTASTPQQVVKAGDYIFYASTSHSELYRYDLSDGTEKKIMSSVYNPALEVNDEGTVLYIGESDLSGSDLYYYDVATGEKISASNYNDSYGFPYPKKSLIYEEGKLYYAGRDFDPLDATRFDGDYDKTVSLIQVKNGLAFTASIIYDKETHEKLGTFKSSITYELIELSENAIYLYDYTTSIIKKYSTDGEKITTDNIVDLVSATGATKVTSSRTATTDNSGVTTVKMDSTLTRWVTDEEENMIYAISKDSKALFFINRTTLCLEETILLKSAPDDVIVDEGKIYVSLSDTGQIKVLSAKERKITDTIYTSYEANQMIKDGQKIYYSADSSKAGVVIYNLEDDTESILVSSSASPALALDTENNILYIGESSSSASKLYYYDTLTGKKISTSTYGGSSTGFYTPGRTLFLVGDKVYYAGRDFETDTATRFGGDYDGSKKLTYVSDRFVFASNQIYDRETHILLGSFASGLSADLINLQENNLYVYDSTNKCIKKYTNDSSEFTQENIIAAVSGTEAEPIQTELAAETVLTGVSSLEVGASLDNWVKDEETGMLYAYSAERKTVFFINSATLAIENSITFTCKPTDLLLEDELLYVALGDASRIEVISIKNAERVQIIYTLSDPDQIAKNGDVIYYASKLNTRLLKSYDMVTGEETKISTSVSKPDLLVNAEDQILYVGEYGSSSSEIYYYSTVDNSLIGKTRSLSYPSGTLHFDGERVYYGSYAFHKTDPSDVLGQYGNSTVILAIQDSIVYTDTGFYRCDTFENLNTENEYDTLADLVEIADDGQILYYYAWTDKLVKMDLSQAVSVFYKIEEDSEEYLQDIVNQNDLLQKPEDPSRSGYVLIGWYTDEAYQTEWNFKTDRVTSPCVLYAQWKKTPGKVSVSSIKCSGGNSIVLKWSAKTDATAYVIYRSVSLDGEYTSIESTSKTTYTDSSGEFGTKYYYKIRAAFNYGLITSLGEYSSIVFASTGTEQVKEISTKVISGDSIELSWKAVEGAEGYEISHSALSAGTYVMLEETTDTTYTVTGLTAGSSYYYKIRTFYFKDGQKIYSDYSDVVGKKLTITAPSSLKAAAQNYTAIQLSWSASAGAEEYEIYRATSQNGTYTLIGTTEKTNFTDTVSKLGQTYYYKVRTCYVVNNQKKYTGYVTVSGKTATLKATSITTEATGISGIKISWNKVTGATSYEIYRSTSKTSGYQLIKTTTATSYQNTKLGANKTYYYMVRAVRTENGVKAYSEYSSKKSAKTYLSTPAKVTAKKSSSSVKVTFSAVSESSGYEIYRSVAKNGTYKKIKTTTAKSYTDKSAVKGKTYYYKVRAYKVVNGKKVYSSYSVIASCEL